MKSVSAALCVFTLLLAPCAAAVADRSASTEKQRTITQVVKLLEDMLEKSKDEGNTERELYAKYKCYCDTNEKEKTEEIDSLTEEIAILESKIEEIQASTGGLSKEVAKLKADMAANNQSQTEATNIRDKENIAFLALEADLEQAIDQMDRAIQTLADIGADQSLGESAADHELMMAGHEASLIAKKLHTSVKQALLAASAFITPKQTKTVEAFIQAPFTGTYTAQSGEVVGILKDMRDTFKANLEQARNSEETALTAYNKLMKVLTEAYDEMDASHTTKQGELGGNDGDLATKKTQLSNAESDKADAEAFLEQLLDMCSAKAKEYKGRVMLRTNEEAAIAEAISILNSDAAFATFGGVSATSTGSTGASFVQIKQHTQVHEAREQIKAFLAPVAKKDARVNKVLSLVQAENPFDTVLTEIKKMLAILVEEGKEDQEQYDFCIKERRENNAELTTKNGEKDALIGEIDALDTTINDPVTGLKAQISEAETSLEENLADQKTETAERTEDNLAYQKDIANLVEAEALLEKAHAVLKKYYDSIAFVQKGASASKKEDPAPPSTWADDEDTYTGQSGSGNGAIGMLDFILSETKKEESEAHQAEETAQHAFEDSMQSLKDQQALLIKSIATLKEQLATKEEEKLAKEADLKATKEAIAAIEAYLLKIKPGCDFIEAELDNRKAARAEEKSALNNAATLIKGTPAYQEAVAAAHQESLGDCKEICNDKGEDHVECKACLADTSVPGYCAGHPGTAGC